MAFSSPLGRAPVASVLCSLTIAIFAACGSGSNTTRITVNPPSSGGEMKDVYVIVGPQKEYMPLFTRPLELKYAGQRTEISVLYQFQEKKQTWTSPEFDPAAHPSIQVDIDGSALPAAAAFRYRPAAR